MPDVAKIATGFRKGLLGKRPSTDMCFVVTLPLGGYLRVCGIPCEPVEGYVGKAHHWWLDMLDGNILDPTADQFATPEGEVMPPVYYGPLPEWYKLLEESPCVS